MYIYAHIALLLRGALTTKEPRYRQNIWGGICNLHLVHETLCWVFCHWLKLASLPRLCSYDTPLYRLYSNIYYDSYSHQIPAKRWHPISSGSVPPFP